MADIYTENKQNTTKVVSDSTDFICTNKDLGIFDNNEKTRSIDQRER